jgi:hypothetical protein
MKPKVLLLTILASPIFAPIGCFGLTFPAAHGLSYAGTRDLAAGEPAYLPPVYVALVARDAPARTTIVAAGDVRAALAQHPGLTPLLPANGASDNPADGRRFVWTVEDHTDGVQLVRAVRVSENWSVITRYRASADGVVPLTSRAWSVGHAFSGAAIAFVLMAIVQWVARRRLRAATAAVPATA